MSVPREKRKKFNRFYLTFNYNPTKFILSGALYSGHYAALTLRRSPVQSWMRPFLPILTDSILCSNIIVLLLDTFTETHLIR